MAYVTLTNVSVLDNPTAFTNPFQFEVTFECMQPLDDDLEWKITYVGSAENESHDQVLEEILVGPVPVGTNKFVFQANSPNVTLIPDEDKIGVTVVLVTCSYRNQEFVRVGYYVNNQYTESELIDNPPEKVDIAKLQRNILADKPRVTRFPIVWATAAGGEKAKGTGNENSMPVSMDANQIAMMDAYLMQAAGASSTSMAEEDDDLIIGNIGDDDLLPEDDEDDDEDDDEMSVDEIDLMDDL